MIRTIMKGQLACEHDNLRVTQHIKVPVNTEEMVAENDFDWHLFYFFKIHPIPACQTNMFSFKNEDISKPS